MCRQPATQGLLIAPSPSLRASMTIPFSSQTGTTPLNWIQWCALRTTYCGCPVTCAIVITTCAMPSPERLRPSSCMMRSTTIWSEVAFMRDLGRLPARSTLLSITSTRSVTISTGLVNQRLNSALNWQRKTIIVVFSLRKKEHTVSSLRMKNSLPCQLFRWCASF